MPETNTSATTPPDSGATFVLESRLALHGCDALIEELRALIGSSLTLDASQVSSITASSVQVLLAAAKSWRNDGQSLAISEPSEQFLECLERLGIHIADLEAHEVVQ